VLRHTSRVVAGTVTVTFSASCYATGRGAFMNHLPISTGLFFAFALGARAEPPQPPAAGKTVQETNDAFVAAINLQIKGHEKEPAGKVFKNVKWLTGVPAANLVTIMNFGYSRALGVACTHCHDEKDFSSDEKRPKRAAREMQVLHRSINDQLAKMQNLKDRPDHFINCATCHRGMLDPRQPLPGK